MDIDKNQADIIRASEYFDADWYKERYRDVGASGMEPAEHYLAFGKMLHRDPGPRFSVHAYLAANPDVADSGENPLLHLHRNRLANGTAPSLPAAPSSASESGFSGLSPSQLEQVKAAFNAGFYLDENPHACRGREEPFLHYMTRGWRMGLDPCPGFSTTYYLENTPGLRESGKNPFIHYVLHGKRERRQALAWKAWLERRKFQPKVTVVVPNYNHARFLRQRIDSILCQSYSNLEILLLDDDSNDGSREIIEEYRGKYPDRIRAILNERNTGNVFRQWRRGVEAASGELIWICESDDFCEPDFLEIVVPTFKDRSVNIAFGCIQFVDERGAVKPGLDAYREGAEAGIWSRRIVRPAKQWFSGSFGIKNLIPNVGGSVWRRQVLPQATWEDAQTYDVLGDWFLYLHVAGGGQIAYEPDAVAYFRQHDGNTSAMAFRRISYYEEHRRLMTCLCRHWDVRPETVDRFARKALGQYREFGLEAKFGPFENFVDREDLKSIERERLHILIAFVGFHAGGGEIFPIHLANELRRQGWTVSMLAYDMAELNESVLASLDSSVPVYFAAQVEEMGVDAFMASAGISLVHSHMLWLDEFLILKHCLDARIPYVVSLHGSYEASGIDGGGLQALADRVDHWVYTAEKNLVPFRTMDVDKGRFSSIHNGMPHDPRPFPLTRGDLGIAEEAIVYALVARGAPGKGWAVATSAFTRLREAHPDRRMHLLACGDGVEADRQAELHGDDPDITFLGYQSCINGIYRMSDCAIVPTRFSGESFPLCIIQAMQEGKPVVATDVGEIARMLAPDGVERAGVLVGLSMNSKKFVDDFSDGMARMLDAEERRRLGQLAMKRSERYGIGDVAREYGDLYGRVVHATMRKLDC